VEPTRQSIPEAAAYRIVGGLLDDLRKVERLLASLTYLEASTPALERAMHLRAVREAIATLQRIPTPTD
jgi:hypothetical protein